MSEPDEVTATVAHNVRVEREERGWSAQSLADLIKEQGGSISRAIIANLENGRITDVTVSQLAALARAFNVDPWSLTKVTGPVCLVCSNSVPSGFRCLNCGRDGDPQPKEG